MAPKQHGVAPRVPHPARCSWLGLLLVAALTSPIIAAFAADFFAHALRGGSSSVARGFAAAANTAVEGTGSRDPCAALQNGTIHEELPASASRVSAAPRILAPTGDLGVASGSGTPSAAGSASCTPRPTVLYPTPHPTRGGGAPAVAAMLFYGLAVDVAGRRANATGPGAPLPPPRGLCERTVTHHELRTAVTVPAGRQLLLTTTGCVVRRAGAGLP